MLEHCLERTLPTLAKCRNLQCALQLLAGLSWQIQESVNLGHTHSLWTISNFYDVIARPNFSFLQGAKVESWSVMRYEQRRHVRLVHADAHAVACDSWLRYLQYSTTDAVSITNADLMIRKSFDSEVFSELAEGKVIPSENAFPVVIRVHLINKNRALLSTMTGEIALRIANNIEREYHSSAFHRRFPDPRMDGLPVPCHVARETNIY